MAARLRLWVACLVLGLGAVLNGQLDRFEHPRAAGREDGDAVDRGIERRQEGANLLRVFVERPRRVLNRDQLLELSRGPESDSFDRAIDTQVSRLRRKLAARSAGDLIRTVRSEGYMFLPSVTRGS